jgi:hypothetical protein
VKRGIVIESHVSRGEKGEGRMRKLTKSFQKRQSIASRVLCFLLVLAMVVTMVPALGGGNSTVQAAEKEKNLTIHFMMPSNWGWTTPAIQFSFFFAFLLYSKILYYSIRNKSRNLVQIFVNFNQLKYKNAHFLILNIKKESGIALKNANNRTVNDYMFLFFST